MSRGGNRTCAVDALRYGLSIPFLAKSATIIRALLPCAKDSVWHEASKSPSYELAPLASPEAELALVASPEAEDASPSVKPEPGNVSGTCQRRGDKGDVTINIVAPAIFIHSSSESALT